MDQSVAARGAVIPGVALAHIGTIRMRGARALLRQEITAIEVTISKTGSGIRGIESKGLTSRNRMEVLYDFPNIPQQPLNVLSMAVIRVARQTGRLPAGELA
jgi:hypothetical protein